MEPWFATLREVRRVFSPIGLILLCVSIPVIAATAVRWDLPDWEAQILKRKTLLSCSGGRFVYTSEDGKQPYRRENPETYMLTWLPGRGWAGIYNKRIEWKRLGVYHVDADVVRSGDWRTASGAAMAPLGDVTPRFTSPVHALIVPFWAILLPLMILPLAEAIAFILRRDSKPKDTDRVKGASQTA